MKGNENETMLLMKSVRLMQRMRIVLFAFMTSCMVISVAIAKPDINQASNQGGYGDYLKHIHINRSESYLQSTIRKFRSFPHLDKAYRLMDRKRYAEARQEFKQYLEIDPLDLKARMAYIDLLYQFKAYREVIQQANLVLKQQPDMVPAVMYRALARYANGNKAAALVDFSSIRRSEIAFLKDKSFALNMSIIILVDNKSYQQALDLMNSVPDDKRDYSFFMRLARVKAGINDLNGARKNYQQALKLASNNEESRKAYTALAVLFQKLALIDNARDAYQSALKQDPDNPDVLRALANLYYDANQLDKAAAMMEKVIRQRFSDSDQEFLANLYFANQDYLSAARSYEKLLWKQTKESDQFRVYMLLGYAYSKANMPSMAIEAFQNASRLERSNETLQSLATVLETNGEIQRAIKTYQLLVKQQPDPETYIKLSNLYVDAGDTDQALASLELALEFKLSDVQKQNAYRSYMLIGYTFSKENQQAKAVEAFQHAAGLKPSDTSLTSLAYALESKGDIEKAIKIYRDLLRKNNDPETFIRLSHLYVSTGNKENAIHSLDSALQLDVSDAQKKAAYRSQGELYYQSKDYSQAKKAFQKALRIDSDDTYLLNSIALTNIKLGQLKEASDNLKQSLSIKESVDALFTLAEVEKRLNHLDAPVQIYRHLIKFRGLKPQQKSQVLANLGLLYMDRNQEQLAIGYLRAAVARNKSDWMLYRHLGIALGRFNRWDEALEQFEIALRKQQNVGNLLHVARAHRHLGQSELALNGYQNAVDFAMSHSGSNGQLKPILDELGYYYVQMKKNDKAISVWKRSLSEQYDPVIELRLAVLLDAANKSDFSLRQLENIKSSQLSSQQNAERYDLIARIYARKQRYTSAIHAQTKALRFQETAARHFLLGKYLQSDHQYKKAITHLKIAQQQQPENVTYEKTLAYAYSQVDQLDKSAELLESVVEKDPENLDLHKELAYLKLRNAENDQAEY